MLIFYRDTVEQTAGGNAFKRMNGNLPMSSNSNLPVKKNFDPDYETNRVADETMFLKKMRTKRLLYRYFGEIYIGRRVQLTYFRRWLVRLNVASMQQVMEVGSGDGVFCFALAKAYPNLRIVGLELNEVEVRVSEILADQEGLSNLCFESGILSSEQWKEQFDMIFSLDVLEHIKDDIAVMKEMYMALVPGGSLLVHVPHRTYKETDGRLISVPDEEAWQINPGHVRQGYAPEYLRAKLVSVGFDVKETQMTQSRPIAHAHRLYNRVEKILPLRIAILPMIDYLIRQDIRQVPEHGNTVWAWAKKPLVEDGRRDMQVR